MLREDSRNSIVMECPPGRFCWELCSATPPSSCPMSRGTRFCLSRQLLRNGCNIRLCVDSNFATASARPPGARRPGAPAGQNVGLSYLTYVAITGMLGIVLAMAFIPEQRTPLVFGLISLGILLLAYAARVRFGAAAR